MSAEAIVCPHCGKRRAEGGMGQLEMSREELRALATVTAPPAEDRGVIATVLLPHPETGGRARTAELALTVLCLPLVAAGTALLGIGRLFGKRKPTSEAGAVISMAGAGGIGLAWWLADYGAAVAVGVTALEIVLLGIRARIRVTSSRGHRLTAIEG